MREKERERARSREKETKIDRGIEKGWKSSATNKVYIYICYVYDSFNTIQTTTIEIA